MRKLAPQNLVKDNAMWLLLCLLPSYCSKVILISSGFPNPLHGTSPLYGFTIQMHAHGATQRYLY